MRRTLPVLLVALLLALAVQPLVAGEPSLREIELMTLELERVFQPLAGAIDARDVVLKKHRRDLYSLSYPLTTSERPVRRAKRRDDDKMLRTLSCGHMLSEPATPSSVSTAVVSNIDTNYNLWWAVVNQSEIDEERRTTVQVSGPEEFDVEVIDDAPYPANSVTLFVFNPFESEDPEVEVESPFTVPGIYTHRVTVKGAGKAAYRFWVEPLSTTTVER